jgi:ATP-dependent protease HslVU (ClpYQ) peptidase subunit
VTICIAYRVPGLGAVLGCDSRITDTGTGAICSDTDEKWLASGSVLACYAGAIGGLWLDMRETPPRSWQEFRKAFTDIDATQSHDRDYEALVYDRRGDAIYHTDHQGGASRRGLYWAVGCGGPYALGVLDASAAPRTLEAAERLVRRALRIACKRHSSCGGRLRVLVARRGKPVIVT